MNLYVNLFACLLSLVVSLFLWKHPYRLFRESSVLLLSLALFMVYSYFALGVESPVAESYPFRMLAVCICFSVLSVPEKRERNVFLAQMLWLWIEFFGGLSLAYRGFEMSWIRMSAILAGVLLSPLSAKKNREVNFLYAFLWSCVWIFL